MKRMIPYAAFFLAYGGVGYLIFAVLESVVPGTSRSLLGWIEPFVTAPLALWVAKRLGVVSRLGVTVTSAVLVACIWVAVVGILVGIAVPAVGPVGPGYVLRAFARFFALGGWSLLLGAGTMIAAPLLWSTLLLGPREPRVSAAA